MVTAGNCSWCAIDERRRGCTKCAKAESGTWLLPVTALGVAVVLVLVVPVRGVGDGRRGAGRGAGAGDVELATANSGSCWYLRLRLQDDAVLVGLAVDGRDLPLAEGVVERVGHALHGDAEPAGLLAVDLDVDAQAAFLRLGGDLAQRRHRRAVCATSLSAHSSTSSAIGADQRVLVLRAAHAGRDLDVLRRPGNRPSCRGCRRPSSLQPVDDRVDADRCAGRAASA